MARRNIWPYQWTAPKKPKDFRSFERTASPRFSRLASTTDAFSSPSARKRRSANETFPGLVFYVPLGCGVERRLVPSLAQRVASVLAIALPWGIDVVRLLAQVLP
jgi:hypothetical protein